MSSRDDEHTDLDEPEHRTVSEDVRLSRHEKLKLIAHILEVPVSAFEERADRSYFSTRTAASLATDSECAALLSAFRQIADPDVRRRYIALLQSVAAGS